MIKLNQKNANAIVGINGLVKVGGVASSARDDESLAGREQQQHRYGVANDATDATDLQRTPPDQLRRLY